LAKIGSDASVWQALLRHLQAAPVAAAASVVIYAFYLLKKVSTSIKYK
jgi:hypothetical protein